MKSKKDVRIEKIHAKIMKIGLVDLEIALLMNNIGSAVFAHHVGHSIGLSSVPPFLRTIQ